MSVAHHWHKLYAATYILVSLLLLPVELGHQQLAAALGQLVASEATIHRMKPRLRCSRTNNTHRSRKYERFYFRWKLLACLSAAFSSKLCVD